jgi:hypothetical protein
LEQKEEKEAKEVNTLIPIVFFDPLTQTEYLLKEGREGSQRGKIFTTSTTMNNISLRFRRRKNTGPKPGRFCVPRP